MRAIWHRARGVSTVIDNGFETAIIVATCSSRRVTIGDVAAEAGVSVATVSKVINDRYGVAEATWPASAR